jgi:hypothetical protein
MLARTVTTFAALPIALWLSATARAEQQVGPSPEPPALAELWEAPVDLASRDLFNGPWGPGRAPDPDATYVFVKPKKGGINPGMTVRDPQQREWKVKQPPRTGRNAEGPIEVVLSRVLSAIGYHQPPIYFLPSFLLEQDQRARRVPGGRFRLASAPLRDRGEWKWLQNPLVGTKPYQGLLVILLMFNSSDLKDSNNTLYEFTPPSGDRVERWYVVRDLGTALGSTAKLAPVRGDPDVFERRGFIKRIENGFVEFDYDGLHQGLVDHRITPDDVAWASELLSGLTFEQWHEAFRAGGYERPVADRFIRKLQSKIEQGLKLRELTERF